MKQHIKKLLSLVVSKQYDLPASWEYHPPAGIRLVDVRNLEELAEHADAWNELSGKADRLSPLLSYPWMSAFFKNLVNPPEKWLCLFAYENDRLIGILPLVASYSYRILTHSLQLFKLPHHFAHTSGTDGLTLPGREDIIGVFLDYLNHIPAVFPCLSLKHVPEHYASIKYFSGRKCKMCVIQKPAGFEAFVPVTGNGEEYFSGLSAKFRQNLNRASRELAKVPDIRFIFCENTRSAQENTARFLDVENRNWKGQKSSSIKNYPSSAVTFEAAADGLSRQGLMAFSFLESGGKTIAAHYAMRNNRTLYILKMGYDAEYTSCSPGNLLMLKVIQAACDSGNFDEVNLISNPPELSKWNVQRRTLYHLIIFPKIPVLSRLLSLIIQSGKVHNFDIER
jgi:hypothetical protein